MKKARKSFLLAFMFLILLINSIYLVNGLGLSISYNDKDRPLIIERGETKEIDFLLLSSARESSKKLRLDIINGMEIASLSKNEFELPSDGEEKGHIKIKIPDFYENGKEELVTISIKEISSSENLGSIGFSFSSKISFIVKIRESEKLPESKTSIYVLFAIILIIITLVLIALIYIVIKRRKFYSKNNKKRSIYK